VFDPLEAYINQAMDNWMRDPQNANKAMTIHVSRWRHNFRKFAVDFPKHNNVEKAMS